MHQTCIYIKCLVFFLGGFGWLVYLGQLCIEYDIEQIQYIRLVHSL